MYIRTYVCTHHVYVCKFVCCDCHDNSAKSDLEAPHGVGKKVFPEIICVHQDHANVFELGTGKRLVVLPPIPNK